MPVAYTHTHRDIHSIGKNTKFKSVLKADFHSYGALASHLVIIPQVVLGR